MDTRPAPTLSINFGGFVPNNYFKVIEWRDTGQSEVVSTRILGVFAFDDLKPDTILDAYGRSVLLIKRVWKGYLDAVRYDPKCPYRLRSNTPIINIDLRKIRLYDREGMGNAL